MIEQRLADSFRAAVADEPPLGFNPDEVVDRAAQRTRRRHATIGTAAATTVIAVAAITVFSLRTPGGQTHAGAPGSEVRPTPPATAPSAPSTMAPPRTKGNRTQPPTQPSFPGSAEAISRLDKVGPQLLGEHVPDLRFNAPDGGTWHAEKGRRLLGAAYLVAGTKHRYVTLAVSHEGDKLDLAADPAAGGGWGPLQNEEVQPDGSYVRLYASPPEDGTGGILVVHLRTDGVIAMADTTMKPEPGRTGFVVTKDVLRALATDPRLTF